MKKSIGILFVASFLLTTNVGAQLGTVNRTYSNANITAALQDIYSTQNITDQSKVSCSKVTDVQFEKLGDAVMGSGISEQQHAQMENMMGGEGSATLDRAHLTMGRSYLGCWANYNSGPVNISMMNGNLSSNYSESANRPWRMMGDSHGDYFWLGSVTMVLFWVLLILSIVALVKSLKKNK